MGGGVARQLALQYPQLENEYKKFCKDNFNDYKLLKGRVFIVNEDKIIANIFSQTPDFDTDYEMMRECFEIIKDKSIEKDLSIAIPYNIGCRHC